MTPTRKSSAPKRTSRTEGPSEIAPGVFVGGWKDAAPFRGTRFCVLDEADPQLPPSTHIPIYREETKRVDRKNLDRLAEAVRRARDAGEPVLIFCGMGVRRGSLGGAWYLHRSEHLSLEDAYARVRAVRPQIQTVNEWVEDPTGLE
jgi:hypothetical protein